MQSDAATETDRTPEVIPRIRHTVPWRVVAVSALPEFRLHVRFVDGTAGEVDMSTLLRSSGDRRHGVHVTARPGCIQPSTRRTGCGAVAERGRSCARRYV